MLKKSASSGKAEVKAKVEAKVKKVRSSFDLNLDLNLPQTLQPCWTAFVSILWANRQSSRMSHSPRPTGDAHGFSAACCRRLTV